MLTALKIIIFIPLCVFLFCFVLLVRNTFLSRYPDVTHPSTYGMPCKEIDFSSTDGMRLKGWLIIKDKNQPVIILCHGLGTNKSDVIEFANFLYQADYNVFIFDFRAHGESEGTVNSFGYREQKDLEGAIKELSERGDIAAGNYGVFGISMGAAVAIMVGERNPRIKAIVVDSPYLSLEKSITDHAKFLYNFPKFPIADFSILAYRLRFWINSKTISPLKAIGQISPRPVLIINGADDPRMPASDAKKLYEAAKEPKQLWLVPEAGHLESYSAAGNEYKRRVVDFFNRYLRKNN